MSGRRVWSLHPLGLTLGTGLAALACTPTLIPRTGFFQGLVRPGKPVRTIRVPNRAGVGHQWAYLPDVARTMRALLEKRETLPPFARFHMGGHWDADGTEMAQAIRDAAARHGQHARIAAFPWWMTRLLAPFVPTLGELQEMRYLWKEPIRLDGGSLKRVLGEEPHTPLEDAVEATLAEAGCFNA